MKIIIAVTAIFLLFYLITYVVESGNKNKNQDNDETEVTIQYDEILISNLLEQPNKEYFVLAYDENDQYFTAYNTYLSTYKTKTGALRYYTSIISNGFNKIYYDKDADSKPNVSKLRDFKLNKSTLFRITDCKITKTNEGHDAIITYLNSLIA